MTFGVWLLSLDITSSKFSHTVACVSISFHIVAEYYFITRIGHILFIHSSVDGNVHCSHLLAGVSDAAINTHVQVFG